MSADGAMVKYTNITLQDCIRGAYRVRDFQIVGPDWMTKARFEINARLPAGISGDQIPEMLQALLAERFKLKASGNLLAERSGMTRNDWESVSTDFTELDPIQESSGINRKGSQNS